jgi:hypothetical protein
MIGDHRRILATGIARVRAKIKYNPVVFELMPPVFTLSQLPRYVEAIAGLNIHKPNFRRLIEQQQLVEETGETVFALVAGARLSALAVISASPALVTPSTVLPPDDSSGPMSPRCRSSASNAITVQGSSCTSSYFAMSKASLDFPFRQ